MAKRSKKTVQNSLDKLWSLAVRKRDKRCLKCGSTDSLQSHHIFGRRAFSTRWNIQNGITLCAGCHIWKTDSFEKAPYLQENIDIVLRAVGGQEELNKLEQLFRTPYKSTLEELLELEKSFKSIIH